MFDELYTTANKSNMNHKHGCIITHRNKILSAGFNYYKLNDIFNNSSKEYTNNKYSVHAEIAAISKVNNKKILSECKIYIMKLTTKNVENGIPCHNCQKIIDKFRLKIECVVIKD